MQTCTQPHPASATIFTWLCQALVDVVSTSHSRPSMCTGAGEACYTILSWGERERERGREWEKLIEDLVCWLCQAEAQVASLLPSVWNQSGSVGVLSSEELADSF